MTDLWMPGATRLDIGDHAPTDGGPAKAIAHITWDRNATKAKPIPLVPYEDLVNYFGRNPDGKPVAPHILWDPFTGRCTQFVPANSRSKSLADATGGTRTNRAGRVVLQVEALFFPYCTINGKAYARLIDTPCKGWDQLHAWVKSWGVPDVWPMGRPVDFTSHRSEATWETEAGWYAHAQVPENDHQDPGSWPTFTPQIEEDPMAGMTARDIYNAVWRTDVMTPPTGTETKDNPTWAAESVLRDAANQARGLRATVQAQGAAITQLAAALAAHNNTVDVDALIARIETAIQGIDVHLTTS